VPSSFTQNTDEPCFQFRHRAQQYSRQKKILYPLQIFSSHTSNIFSSADKVFSVLAARAENIPTKHFLSALHTAVFPAAFSLRYFYKVSRLLSESKSTIFLRSVFPGLPPLVQVSAVNSRHSL